MNFNNKNNKNKYHLQQQALVDKLMKPGIFTGLPNGFIKCDMTGNLDLLADNCYVCVTTGVKAAYFCPDSDDSVLCADILGMIYTIAWEGIGVGIHTPVGYTWLVFDTARYHDLCRPYGLKEDEFRIYPQK
jgi:hypothetical protein